MVNRASDVMGRYINYTYQRTALNCIPLGISYGMDDGVANTVQFTYEAIRNANTQLINIEGQKGKVTTRLKKITTATAGKTYRTYECVYDSTLDASKTRYSRLTQLVERNGNGEALNPITLSWKGLPSFTPQTTDVKVDIEAKDYGQIIDDKAFLCADMNGDGVSDIVKVANIKCNTYSSGGNSGGNLAAYAYVFLSEVSSDGSVSYRYSKVYDLGGIMNFDDLKSCLAGSSSIDLDGDGKADVAIQQMEQIQNKTGLHVTFLMGSMKTLGINYVQEYSSDLPLVLSMDVDKNGRDEYLCLENNAGAGKYHGAFFHYTGSDNIAFDKVSFQLQEQPLKVFAGDYNNDGLSDLIFLHRGGYTIYYNQGGSDLTKAFDEAHKTFSDKLADKWRIVQGDFNGDGLIDFAYFQQDWDIFFALNNGDGTFDIKKAATTDITDRGTGQDDNKFSLLPYDMDSDGKTDLMLVKGDYEYHGGLHHHYSFRNTRIAWLRSDGNKLNLDKEVYLDSEDDALEKNYLIGSFSADGQVGVLYYGKNIVNFNGSDEVKMRLITNSAYSLQAGKVVAVADGMFNRSNITYSSLQTPSCYLHQYKAQYPMVDVHLAFPVVSYVSSLNGAAGALLQYYSYAGLVAHVQGKGLLGFAKTIVENRKMGETTQTEVTGWNTDFYVPSQTTVTTTVSGEHACSVSDYAVTPKKGTYFSYPSTVVDTDLDGYETKTITNYNTDKGYLNSQTQYFGGNDMYKLTGYASYQQKGGVYLPILLLNVQKHEDDSQAYAQITSLTYDDKGQVVQKIDKAQSSIPLTTQYTYDKFGNVLSSTQSGTGVSTLTHINTYDSTGRFVIKTTQNPAALTTEYTYDTWGNVLTKKEYADASNPQVTRYTYDGWNRMVSTVNPMGIKKTVTYERLNLSRSAYRVTTAEDNAPSSSATYDAKGRLISSQEDLEGNLEKTVNCRYNVKGQKYYEEIRYGNVLNVLHYTYDSRGRLTSQLDEARSKNLSYQYEGRKTTTHDGDKTFIKVVDAWGNVKSSSDPVSEVSYTYASNGQPSVVTTNGSSVKMTYDDAGNKISMEDPDAGTVSYSYAADGKLLSQTDARGIETLYTYDVWGKLLQKQVGDMTFTNTYGTSGIEKNLLVKRTLGTNYEEYTHDKYGRLVKKVRNAYSKKNFLTEYAYNSKNQLEGVTYPGGLTVSYFYDDKGFPTSARSNGLVLDSLVSYDGLVATHLLPYGMTYKKTLASNLTLQNLNICKGDQNLFNMDFNYDPQSGNLLSRTGMLPEKEIFEYDALDRLVSVNTGNTSSLNISYANNGNIMSKTDVGNYTYSSVKPHAVMKIDNANAYQYTSDLTTEYNDMGRIKLISQRQTYPISMKFAYGADGSLWNLDYTPSMRSTDIGGHRAWSRYYDDNYEYLYSAAYRRDFYYLTDHVMAVRDYDKDFKFYVVAKDNLGSIVGIYNANGDKVFSASYDAWGKQTVSDTKDDMHLMLHGYCGHTMLSEFDLIDMKGRLYDPVVGRFLSPDNYVQLPGNSQNYNRYSYCLNNPLKYTDPSGELFGLDDALIVSTAFGAITGAMKAKMSDQSMWKGALAGGLSSWASYGVGSLFGHGLGNFGNELLRSGAHGVTSGALSWLNGGSFGQGMLSGFASSLAGSGAQALGFGSNGVLASTSLAGGIASWAAGGSFMNGVGIGSSVGTFNHTGGKIRTIEKKLPPVYIWGDKFAYRKTFWYWFLGVGSGVSSGPYGMWNPDAISLSVGLNAQILSFHAGVETGVVAGHGKILPYINYNKGCDLPTSFFDFGGSANVNVYMKNGDTPFDIQSLEGDGYNAGFDLGPVSIDYGTGVNFLGLPTTDQYHSFGLGLGAGLGAYANGSSMVYLFHY